jgi:hypothetical protein
LAATPGTAATALGEGCCASATSPQSCWADPAKQDAGEDRDEDGALDEETPLPIDAAGVPPAAGIPVTASCRTVPTAAVAKRIPAGPVAESTKVLPAGSWEPVAAISAPDGGAGGSGSTKRRAILLHLATEQLREGLVATAERHTRMYRWLVLYGIIAIVAIAVQFYCVLAETDHWARRAAGAVAVAAAPLALLLVAWQVPLLCMNASLRRGFGQLMRMAEMWELAARGTGVDKG